MTCEHCGHGMGFKRRVHFAKVDDPKPCPGSWPPTGSKPKKEE